MQQHTSGAGERRKGSKWGLGDTIYQPLATMQQPDTDLASLRDENSSPIPPKCVTISKQSSTLDKNTRLSVGHSRSICSTTGFSNKVYSPTKSPVVSVEPQCCTTELKQKTQKHTQQAYRLRSLRPRTSQQQLKTTNSQQLSNTIGPPCICGYSEREEINTSCEGHTAACRRFMSLCETMNQSSSIQRTTVKGGDKQERSENVQRHGASKKEQLKAPSEQMRHRRSNNNVIERMAISSSKLAQPAITRRARAHGSTTFIPRKHLNQPTGHPNHLVTSNSLILPAPISPSSPTQYDDNKAPIPISSSQYHDNNDTTHRQHWTACGIARGIFSERPKYESQPDDEQKNLERTGYALLPRKEDKPKNAPDMLIPCTTITYNSSVAFILSNFEIPLGAFEL